MAVNDWLKVTLKPKFYEGFKGFIFNFTSRAKWKLHYLKTGKQETGIFSWEHED